MRAAGTFYTTAADRRHVVRALAPLSRRGARSHSAVAHRRSAMGSGRSGRGLPISQRVRERAGTVGRLPCQRHRRLGAGRDQARDRRALLVRRRSESDGGAARAPLALARDAGGGSSAQLSRSSAAGGRQPAWHIDRGAPASTATDPARGRPATAALRRRGRRRRAARGAAAAVLSRNDGERTIEQVRAERAGIRDVDGSSAALLMEADANLGAAFCRGEAAPATRMAHCDAVLAGNGALHRGLQTGTACATRLASDRLLHWELGISPSIRMAPDCAWGFDASPATRHGTQSRRRGAAMRRRGSRRSRRSSVHAMPDLHRASTATRTLSAFLSARSR